MPKPIKWILGILVGIVILIILAIIIVPLVIDLETYKPRIEAGVSKAAGRPFKLGGRIEPSLFPWVGVTLSDVHLGNPSGFESKDFVYIKNFEVRVKLLPLLSGQYEFKRFVVEDPRIVLEKRKNGQASWQGLGTTSGAEQGKAPSPAKPPAEKQTAFPVKSLAVGEFAIRNGSVLWIDHAAGTRKEIRSINLKLENLSLKEPVGIDFNALADGHPITLKGKIGPVGPEPGKGQVPVDLTAKMLEEVALHIKGQIRNPAGDPRFDMTLEVQPFSVRQVMASARQPMPMETADDDVLQNVALAMKVSGSPQKLTVSEGRLTLDDSRLAFNGQAQAFDRPDLSLDASLDRIDLDRYLPPPSEQEEPPAKKGKKNGSADKPTDYGPLRKLLLDAHLKIGQLKVKNSRLENIELRATAKNGVFRLDPLNMNLYKGQFAASSTIDVRQNKPRSAFNLNLSSVQAGTLLKDLLDKEFIEGVLSAAVNLQFSGDKAKMIRKTLDGKGELKFNDGAIVGIDLADMVRNVQAAFGAADKPTEKPKTDFSELLVPFGIQNGRVNIDNARLNSPLLRLLAGGNADLVEETLDLRVEPKFVASLVGQGDTQQRSGLMVPVIISGRFADPKFKPDLKGLISQPLPGKEKVSKDIEKKKEELREELENKARDLLKGLPFGGGGKE